MNATDYSFGTAGLGSILKHNLLQVPANQRPYAWKKEHVGELLTDIKEAMGEDDEIYFLGTIVLVKTKNRKLIADGQQRIATASIIIARCRDLLRSIGELEDAASIEGDFLRRYDRKSRDYESHLSMNIEDEVYFREKIIEPDWVAALPPLEKLVYPSNERLYRASEEALSYLALEIAHLSPKAAAKTLNDWIGFFEDRASVVVVTVPDEVGAFRMFETLNDRGLRASQADILKNYFYSRVKQAQLDLVQAQWNQMYGALADRFEKPDEQTIKYIKNYWTLSNGLTRDRELASDIKKNVKNAKDAAAFITGANAAVADYVALFNPRDPKWIPYGDSAREDLAVLTQVIDIDQIVPLVFAVAHKFSIPEARKAFKLFVSWSVRFMLGGSGRAGRLDKQYATLAHDVGLGRKKTAKELRDFLADKVPGDDAFKRAVREAKVSNAVLARYYLICFEKMQNKGSGELEPATDVNKVNLEHIIPKTFTKDLGITRAEHQDLIMRLGNQTVMKTEWNRDLGNLPFGEKKPVYRESEIGLTNRLTKYRGFARAQIDARQQELAELAPAIWSVKFG